MREAATGAAIIIVPFVLALLAILAVAP